MALDSLTKRASVPGIGRPWYRTKNPDVTLPAAWRQASGNTYAGVTLSGPAATVVGCTQAIQVYQPGAVAVQAYQPGAVATQIGCK